MADDEQIPVEVAYGRADEQVVLDIKVPLGATVEQAIRISGILENFPEIDLDENKVGIYGRLVKLQEAVKPQDRVEIYRPLIADPKEVRRRRAAEGKPMKKGL